MKRLILTVALVTSASILPALGAEAGRDSCDTRTNNTYKKLLDCTTLDGARSHQAAFQAIADANDGTRAAGTPGYDATVDYMVDTLTEAGYDVELNGFPFTYVPLGELEQLTPISADYDTGSFSGTGFGEVVGNVIPVDLALGTAGWPADPATSTSGCEAADFAGLDFR